MSAAETPPPSTPPSSPSPSSGPNPQAARGAQLVRLSRWLLLGGVGLIVTSCGAGIAVKVPLVLLAGAVLGSGVIVAAAVVGQVGRGLQGRII
jgi:hypothetical protein